jgi:hypothetical protein
MNIGRSVSATGAIDQTREDPGRPPDDCDILNPFGVQSFTSGVHTDLEARTHNRPAHGIDIASLLVSGLAKRYSRNERGRGAVGFLQRLKQGTSSLLNDRRASIPHRLVPSSASWTGAYKKAVGICARQRCGWHRTAIDLHPPAILGGHAREHLLQSAHLHTHSMPRRAQLTALGPARRPGAAPLPARSRRVRRRRLRGPLTPPPRRAGPLRRVVIA